MCWNVCEHGYIFDRANFCHLSALISVKSKLCYNKWSVYQSTLVSNTHLGPITQFLLLSDEGCPFWQTPPTQRAKSLYLYPTRTDWNCVPFFIISYGPWLWWAILTISIQGLPSHILANLVKVMNDGKSDSLVWFQATIWDPYQVFPFIFLEMFFRQLQVCYHWSPSLMRGQVPNLQLMLGLASTDFLRSAFHRTDNRFCLKFETSQFWRARSPYLIILGTQ